MSKQQTASKESIITIQPMNVKHAIVHIAGDGDLVLNKMNASNSRQLISDDRKAAALWEAQHKNRWEDIITSMHWRDGIVFNGRPIGEDETNSLCTEEVLNYMLEHNAPCITAFGLKKSWGQAVVRNEIDKYATKFDNAVNIVASGGLIPITFTEWKLDTRLMSPKRGAPITTRLNHFCGWKADIHISYTENVFSITEIAKVIDCAGFGIGIGSGRTSGYGRYHIEDIS